MSLDLNDPRLTALALGELDETERAGFEAEIADHPEALKFVTEVRATARLLTEQLRAEPSPGLTPEQRLAIEAEAKPKRPAPRTHWRALALAASVMIGGTALSLTLPVRIAPRTAAPVDVVSGPVLATGRDGNIRLWGDASAPASQAGSKAPKGIPSNVAFGRGAEAKTLYVTVDVSLYRIPMGIAGYRPGE